MSSIAPRQVMISALMLYSAKVALLVGIAALALERVAVWRGLPRRGLWAAALTLSLALPGVALLIPAPAAALPANSTPPLAYPDPEPEATAQAFQPPFTDAPSAIRSSPGRRKMSFW